MTINIAIVTFALREAARAEANLEDKSRQLEMADRYKSHFLASASHDLRQPLHALNLFVAQLQTEKKPAERKRLVSRIDAAVASMNELFEALLDMTKLEAGILQANPAEFAVQRLLDRIETTFAAVADFYIAAHEAASGTLANETIARKHPTASSRASPNRRASRPTSAPCRPIPVPNRQVMAKK